MTLITDHKWRNLEYGYQLKPKERADFDYIDADDFDLHDFLRYRGVVYDVGEFEVTNVKGWDGQHVDSYFSAVLIRFGGGDHDRVQVGLWLA